MLDVRLGVAYKFTFYTLIQDNIKYIVDFGSDVMYNNFTRIFMNIRL